MSGKEIKLSRNEEKVLIFLCENKSSSDVPLSEITTGTGLSTDEARDALCRLREIGYVGGGQNLLADTMAVLKEMDEGLKPTSRGFCEHIILLASAISEADETFLARELSYDREFVGLVGSRLRNAGIWKGSVVRPSNLERWKESPVSFFLDGSVAIGDLMVVGGSEDNPQYQMTPGGKAHVESMLNPKR